MKKTILIKKYLFSAITLLFLSDTKNSTISIQNEPAIQNNQNESNIENILDETTIGSGAGRLNAVNKKLSDVTTFGGLVKEEAKNKLITEKGIEISFTGKERLEGYTDINTKYLNNYNINLDNSIVPGKSTTDIGMLVKAGKNIGFENDVIELGIDLRSRTTWGKPQSVGKTTTSILSEKTTIGSLEYGSHAHTIGIPIVYVRGVDISLDVNELFFNLPDKYPHQKLKLGFFPFEIGRGISLGAAYLISPEVLSYAPVDVIQEFAPGFLLHGNLLKNKELHYSLYLGIIKNLSGSGSDLQQKTRSNQYGMEYFPYRGSGIFNIVSALQVDWQCLNNKYQKLIISPYLIAAHEGAGKVVFPEDSMSNLLTYGFAVEAERNHQWDLSFEFAANKGSQKVFGIDTNTVTLDQRICSISGKDNIINPDTSVGVWTNTQVLFTGYIEDPISRTTDVANKNAIYLGDSSMRQVAINNVYKSSSSNGSMITVNDNGTIYNMQNSTTRFRDPYTNNFNGFMTVLDIGRHFTLCDQPMKLAFALGFASGDNNPNKSIHKKNDHITDSTYNGFIAMQEIYSGKMVRSAFLMSGAGNMPRINGVPALEDSSDGNSIEPVEYPSPIKGFNNLMYAGTSLNLIYEGKNYNWKWHPNMLIYGQPHALKIHNKIIANKLQKDNIDPFLGTELNLFLEILSKNIHGFKIFAVGSIFIPGQYYKDLTNIPLNKDQNNILYNKNYHSSTFIPLQGNDIAYYFNLGIEFTF